MNTKTFQILTNIFGMLGYTFLIFGLGIVIIVGVILLQSHGFFPNNYSLDIDGNARIVYYDIPKLAESVTYTLAIGLWLMVALFMITLPYWIGKYSSAGLKAMLLRYAYPIDAKKLVIGKTLLVIIGTLLLVALSLLADNTMSFLIFGSSLFALSVLCFTSQHLLAKWARFNAKRIW